MRVAAIIAEYNPLHKGHAYHIEETKKMTKCDYLIVVMSGDFTQRGIPAIMPKHERARMALTMGADLVIELPVTYATGSAERFAYGAVSLLNQLGCVDFLSFGCEDNSLDALKEIAALLVSPPSSFQNDIQKYLDEGYTYPRARQAVIDEYTDFNADLLASPNNLLAVEYLKALIKLKSTIEPLSIKRLGAGYHDLSLDTLQFASASGIREHLKASAMAAVDFHSVFSDITTYIPTSCQDILKETYHKTWPIFLDDFSSMMIHAIFAGIQTLPMHIQDLSSDLWDRICKQADDFATTSDYITSLKTKELTYTRISRALLHLMLSTSDSYTDSCPYARILGFRKNSSELITQIRNKSTIPLFHKVSEAENILTDEALKMFRHDVNSTHLYHAQVKQKYGTHLPNEYRTVFPII